MNDYIIHEIILASLQNSKMKLIISNKNKNNNLYEIALILENIIIFYTKNFHKIILIHK